MALTPEQFLRKVIREEPQTIEGMVANKLLLILTAGLDCLDCDKIFEEYRTSLLNQLEAVESLHSQFNREEYEEHEKEVDADKE
jgi:hypothetical protein